MIVPGLGIVPWVIAALALAFLVPNLLITVVISRQLLRSRLAAGYPAARRITLPQLLKAALLALVAAALLGVFVPARTGTLWVYPLLFAGLYCANLHLALIEGDVKPRGAAARTPAALVIGMASSLLAVFGAGAVAGAVGGLYRAWAWLIG
jgi:hypothetical protein